LWLLRRWGLDEKGGESERLQEGGEGAGSIRAGTVAGGRAPPIDCRGDFRFIRNRDGLDQILQGERQGGGKEVGGTGHSTAQAGGERHYSTLPPRRPQLEAGVRDNTGCTSPAACLAAPRPCQRWRRHPAPYRRPSPGRS
jgi:hypothetical protein